VIKLERKRKKDLKKFIIFLKFNNGVISLSKAREAHSRPRLSRLLAENRETLQIISVESSSLGNPSTVTSFIKAKYHRKKFIALRHDRAAIFRFFCGIFKKRKYKQYEIKAINQWLKNFGFSKAEKITLNTRLGYKYSQVSNNRTLVGIKINGHIDRKRRKKPKKPKKALIKQVFFY